MKKYFAFLIFPLALFSCAGDSTETQEINPSDNLEELAMVPPFVEFKNYIANLDVELPSIDSLFTKYDALKEGFTQEEKDSAYFLANDFMYLFEVEESEQEDYSEKAVKAMEKKYGKAGFVIGNNEGYFYLWPDSKFLEKKFKKDLSTELSNYLEVEKKVNGQLTSDGGLIISWGELAKMILVCEDYMVKNNESKYFDNVMGLYLERMRFFMWGLDNTPIIDWVFEEGEPKHLNEEVAAEYQKLIKDKKHKTGEFIADHLVFLEFRNFDFAYEEQVDLTEEDVKKKMGLK